MPVPRSGEGRRTWPRAPGLTVRAARSPRAAGNSRFSGGHENYFDELMAIMEASKGRPDAEVVAGLRARYDIEQVTGLH